MKRPVEFHTRYFERGFDSLQARDRAALTATFREVNEGDLLSEIIEDPGEGPIGRWDICVLSNFNGGAYLQHWTRPIDGITPELRLHAVTRKLSRRPTPMLNDDMRDRIAAISERSVIGTVFMLVVGQRQDRARYVKLWRHPSLDGSLAKMIVRCWVDEIFEEA